MKNPSVHALAAAGILQQLVDGPSEAHLPNVSAAVGRGWANHTARGYEITAEGLQVLLAVREHQLREGLKRYEAVADAIAAKLLGEIQALDVFNPKWLPAGRPYTYARARPRCPKVSVALNRSSTAWPATPPAPLRTVTTSWRPTSTPNSR